MIVQGYASREWDRMNGTSWRSTTVAPCLSAASTEKHAVASTNSKGQGCNKLEEKRYALATPGSESVYALATPHIRGSFQRHD